MSLFRSIIAWIVFNLWRIAATMYFIISLYWLQMFVFNICFREWYMNVERRENRFDTQGYYRTTPKMVSLKIERVTIVNANLKLWMYFPMILFIVLKQWAFLKQVSSSLE